MKKIIIATILLILFTLTPVIATNYNQKLIDLWYSRKDLQKAFPSNPYNNSSLEKWAKERGWQENSSLYEFYPYKEVVENICNDQNNDLKSQIESLNKRLVADELKLMQIKTGKWVKCCNTDAGKMWCDNSITYCSGHKEIYLLTN